MASDLGNQLLLCNGPTYVTCCSVMKERDINLVPFLAVDM